MNENQPQKENEKTETFMSKKRFSKMVEEFVRDNDMSYLDTIIHICEENRMELEDVKKYLSPSILASLEQEAQSLNFIPRTNTLDV